MIEKITLTVVSGLLAFSLTACDDSDSGHTPTHHNPNDPGGVGMTYNGKLGTDLGGGFVIPFDGSPPGLGYGL